VIPDNRIIDLILRRGATAGVAVTDGLAESLGSYVALLAKWNAKINLTALAVNEPDAGTIDRLIIEPLIASKLIRPEDELSLDVGSGGGSPAIPLVLCCPTLRMTLVESRGRKAAFLREALRHLGVNSARVENCRVEELAVRSDFVGAVDLVTIRAVRIDDALLTRLTGLLSSSGRIFSFGAVVLQTAGLRLVERVPLGPGHDLDVFGLHRPH